MWSRARMGHVCTYLFEWCSTLPFVWCGRLSKCVFFLVHVVLWTNIWSDPATFFRRYSLFARRRHSTRTANAYVCEEITWIDYHGLVGLRCFLLSGFRSAIRWFLIFLVHWHFGGLSFMILSALADQFVHRRTPAISRSGTSGPSGRSCRCDQNIRWSQVLSLSWKCRTKRRILRCLAAIRAPTQHLTCFLHLSGSNLN